ncbi:MAG: glutamate 5-kinase [Chloroflexi bacterium]|nr:glutamate 5-kinase [Chloroflexota bacterium]|tara:strand:+ start:2562 stop:3701 length:1140 start_codon:yes stop_codon:yes gene_type:complete
MTSKENYKYRRIIVKAGTNILTGGSDELDEVFIENLVSQISDLSKVGREMILVSSGAVAAGRGAMKSLGKSSALPDRQVLAAVGQGRLMHLYEEAFAIHGIPTAQALLSRRDVNDRLGYLNLRNTLLSLLVNGVVPVINENDVVAVEELEGEVFGDNDTLSALVANLIDADLLVILGSVEGMYTKDPNIHKDAQLISVVEKIDDKVNQYAGPSSDIRGRGGMVTKIQAAQLATASGVDVVIANGMKDSVISRLSKGEKIGTLFKTSVSKLESRKRWMLSGLSNKSHIKIDQGAVSALKASKTSLLPAGVLGCMGKFERGDIVYIRDENENNIAAGISNYGSPDLRKIQGLNSDLIEKILGHHYGDEVIHRDNMVMLLND